MFEISKKIYFKTISVVLSALMIVSTLTPTVSAFANVQYPDALDCVVVAEDKALFNVDNVIVDGNVYAHDELSFTGSNSMKVNGFASSKVEVNGEITSSTPDEAKIYRIDDFADTIERNTEYEMVVNNDLVLQNTELDATENIKINGSAKLDEVELAGGNNITASKDIVLNLIQNEVSDEYYVVYSENGNITVNGSNLTLNGILYAPYGNITFNVKNLVINGAVYADNVKFNGTTLRINKNEVAENLVTEKLTIDAGEDKEIYVAESIELNGTSNYHDVDFTWSSDESVVFKNANSNNTEAIFTKTGTYTLKLSGAIKDLFASDEIKIVVKPDPTKTFTDDNEFMSGENNNTVAEDGSLTLASSEATSDEAKKSYFYEGVSGINADRTISKNVITSNNDELDISYKLTGVGSVEEDKGIDFIFVIDNSGSMWGEPINNAKEAVKTIRSYMRKNDRCAIGDLYRVTTPLTDDEGAINNGINSIGRGNGSSEMGNGLTAAYKHFDEYSTDNRQKYIMLLSDGENSYSVEKTDAIAQECANRGIKVYSLDMNTDSLNMQNAAIITKGVYKRCPSSEAIRIFMEKLAFEAFNTSARNVVLKTTVADINMVDMENISPVPLSVTKSENDSSAVISWSYDSIEIDEIKDIKISVKYDLFPKSGYAQITRNTALYYNDNDGAGHSIYLDDIILPCVTYAESGEWTGVYDSGRNNCDWTGIYWNGTFASNSYAKLFVAVSDNGTDYSNNVEVSNYDDLKLIKGRFIRITAKLYRGTDGSAPVIDDITVISGTQKLSEPIEAQFSSYITNNTELYVDKPSAFIANITGSANEDKDIEWSVEGTDEYIIDTTNPLSAFITFKTEGEYKVNFKVSAGNNVSENSINVKVNKKEVVSDIIEEEKGSISISIEGPDTLYYNNYTKSKPIKIVTATPEIISWISVRCVGSSRTVVYAIDDEFNSTIDLNYSGKLVVTAYDWSGNPYSCEKEINSVFDNTRPAIEITNSESLYSNNNYYTQDELTFSTKVTDNCELDTIKYYINEVECEVGGDGAYTFVPIEAKRYNFKVIATDKAGNSNSLQKSVDVREDNNKPYFSKFTVNRSSVCVGNEVIFNAEVRDNETGVKSVVYTLNDEEITLDEANTYKFIPEAAGDYIIKGVVTDNRGNVAEKTATVRVNLDTSRPSVSIATNRNNNMLVNSNALVTIKASDNVAVTKIYVDVDGEAVELDENNQFTLTPSKIGKTVITATAYDNVGNSNSIKYIMNVIAEDTVKPSVSIGAGKRYEYRDSTLNFSVNSTDNVELVSKAYHLDGNPINPNTENPTLDYRYSDLFSFNIKELGVGEHTIKVVVTDSSNNTTEQTSTFVISDTSAPSLSLSGNSSANLNANYSLTINFSDASEIKSVVGTVNDEPLTLTKDSPQVITLENIGAGTYNFSVTVTDIYDNTVTRTKTVTVKDTESPAIVVSNIEEEYFYPQVPEIKMTVTDNIELSSVKVMMGDTELEYDGEKIVLPEKLNVGDYTISITATDSSNNTANKTLSFKVSMPRDTVLPVITNLLITPSVIEVGTEIKVYVSATDNSGDVIIEVTDGNGNAFAYVDGVYVYTPTEVGEITINVKASDAEGNYVMKIVTGTVRNDSTAPKIAIDALSTMEVNDTQTIKIVASDNKNLAQVGLKLNGNDVKLKDNCFDFTPISAGEYTFTAYAVDADNNSSSKSFVVTVKENEVEENVEQYLVQTDETKLNDKMKETVAGFKSPADAYEYVVNNIGFDCYINSRRGAIGTYDMSVGNDYDQASLLIGFLREMGYGARYVSGNVTLTGEQVRDLFGAKDFNSACQMFSNAGYKCTMSSKNDTFTITKVWVEAYVPYSTIGVTDESKKDKKLWVELDPSIKSSTLVTGELDYSEVEAEVADEKELLNNYKLQYNDTQEVTSLIDDMLSYKPSSYAYGRSIDKIEIEYLPSQLQYTVNSRGGSFIEYSDNQCDSISFEMYDEFYDSKSLGTYKTSDLYGKRVTIQYVGETGGKTVFEMSGNQVSYNTFKPALTIDGVIVAYGPEVNLGKAQELHVTVATGGNRSSYSDKLVAGSMYAVCLDLGGISESLLDSYIDKAAKFNDESVTNESNYYDEEKMGSFLTCVGAIYYANTDFDEARESAVRNIEYASYTKVLMTAYNITTELNFYGATTAVTAGDFSIDVNLNTMYGVSRVGAKEDFNAFMFASSISGSHWESMIWELLIQDYCVSTISIFKKAADEGQNFTIITNENYSEVISKVETSNADRQDISTSVNAGYTVIIPDKYVTFGEWTGTGYIVADLDEYSRFVYKISGGLNGGNSGKPVTLNQCVESLNSEIVQMVFEENGWDVEKYYSNMFSLCHLMNTVQLIRTLPSLYGTVAIKTVTDAFAFSNSIFSAVSYYEYYGQYLDSILTYGEDSYAGAAEITKIFINLFRDIVGFSTDNVNASVIQILTGGAVDKEAANYLATVISKVYGAFNE